MFTIQKHIIPQIFFSALSWVEWMKYDSPESQAVKPTHDIDTTVVRDSIQRSSAIAWYEKQYQIPQDQQDAQHLLRTWFDWYNSTEKMPDIKSANLVWDIRRQIWSIGKFDLTDSTTMKVRPGSIETNTQWNKDTNIKTRIEKWWKVWVYASMNL